MPDSRSRSRSPVKEHGHHGHRSARHDHRERDHAPESKRRRTSQTRESRSAEPSGRERHKHRRKDQPSRSHQAVVPLPYSARTLSKADLSAFEPLLGHYLSLQKQKDMDEMDDREVKGRWKSFVGKWNRGELAEGWYDPEMFARISEMQPAPRSERRTAAPVRREESEVGDERQQRDENSDGDDYGPTLPPSDPSRRAGASMPTRQDLTHRNEALRESREAQREADRSDLQATRRADRALQRERLDELAPRPDAGTRERRLEKRQLVGEKMRGFREDKSPGMEDERDVAGAGGDDSLAEYKREKENEQRRKSEREVRREEFERAKREEMELRRKAWAEREEGTVSMLRELAKQRFG